MKTNSSNPVLCIQSEDKVLDLVAPMMNDGKLDQDKGSTSATLEITVPHSNEEAPSVDCHESISCSTSMQIDSCTINKITISDEVGSNDPISVNVSDQTTSAIAVRTEAAAAAKFGVYFDKKNGVLDPVALLGCRLSICDVIKLGPCQPSKHVLNQSIQRHCSQRHGKNCER